MIRSFLRITTIVILCKFLITLVSFTTSIFVKPYDTTLKIPYRLSEKEWLPLDKPVLSFLGMFSNWDGAYFTYLSSKPYSHDQFYAFFPFYPHIIGVTRDVFLKPLLDRHLISMRPASILAAGIVGTVANIVAALSLLRLTHLIFFFKENRYLTRIVETSPPVGPFVPPPSSPSLQGMIKSLTSSLGDDGEAEEIEEKTYYGDAKYAEVFTTFCVTLFCLGPGGVFFSANYTEALFAALTFTGLYYVERAIANMRKLRSCHLNVSNNYRITSVVSQNETVQQLYKLAQNETNIAFMEGRYDLLRGTKLRRWADYRILLQSLFFMFVGLGNFILASATRSNGALNAVYFAWGVLRLWETYCDGCNTAGDLVGVRYPTNARICPRDERQRLFHLGKKKSMRQRSTGTASRDTSTQAGVTELRDQQSPHGLPSSLRRRRQSAAAAERRPSDRLSLRGAGDSDRSTSVRSADTRGKKEADIPRSDVREKTAEGSVIRSERTFFATRTMQLGPPSRAVWVLMCGLLLLGLLITVPSMLIQWHAAFRFCGPAPKYMNSFFTTLGSNALVDQDGSWGPPKLPETFTPSVDTPPGQTNPVVYTAATPLPPSVQTPEWCPPPHTWHTLFPEKLDGAWDIARVVLRLVRPPMMYRYIQRRYWGVRFLGYWKLKQIPQFLLASPMILSCLLAIAIFLDGDKKRRVFSLSQVLTRIIRGSYITPLLSCSPIPAIPVPLSDVVSSPTATSPLVHKGDIVEGTEHGGGGGNRGLDDGEEGSQGISAPGGPGYPRARSPLVQSVQVSPLRRRRRSVVSSTPVSSNATDTTGTVEGHSEGLPTGIPSWESESQAEDRTDTHVEESSMQGNDMSPLSLPNARPLQGHAEGSESRRRPRLDPDEYQTDGLPMDKKPGTTQPVTTTDKTLRDEAEPPQILEPTTSVCTEVKILDHVVCREELIENAKSTLRMCYKRISRCIRSFAYPVVSIFTAQHTVPQVRAPSPHSLATGVDSSLSSDHTTMPQGDKGAPIHALQPRLDKEPPGRVSEDVQPKGTDAVGIHGRSETYKQSGKEDIFQDVVFVQGTYDGYSSRVLQEEFRPTYGVPIFHVFGPELIETDAMRTGALFVRKYFLLFPYLVHWLFLILFAAFFMHVNVVTRLCSASNPALYWTLGELWMITHRTLSLSRKELATEVHADAVARGIEKNEAKVEESEQAQATSTDSSQNIQKDATQDTVDATNYLYPLRNILGSQKLVFRVSGVDFSMIRFLIVMWISVFSLFGTVLFSKFYNWT